MHDSRRSGGLLDALDCSPWGVSSGRSRRIANAAPPLYSPEERARRDGSAWTVVQGVLAPVQFLVFLVSLALVARFMLTGDGLAAATWSVVAKTMVLYLIMVTGCIWEKQVFGRYLFAPAFFWEDVFSMIVLVLHTAYLWVVFAGIGDGRAQMMLALAAYAAYVFNAAQFLMKLRAARRDETRWRDTHGTAAGAA